jgi:hypothetical protein
VKLREHKLRLRELLIIKPNYQAKLSINTKPQSNEKFKGLKTKDKIIDELKLRKLRLMEMKSKG